jgi:hypothetical protein
MQSISVNSQQSTPMELGQGQLIENDGYGLVSILKKAQLSSRSSVGFHTIVEVDSV